MRKRLFSAAVFSFAVCALPGAADAALTACPASWTTTGVDAKVEDATGAFTAASSCQYITPADSSVVANETNVNAAAFFGITNWVVVTSQVDPPDDLNGTWSIPAPQNFATTNYMLTFKDGNGTNLTSFLLNELYTNGVWHTPFLDPPFDLPGGSTVHEVSHYSLFRSPSTPTPNNIPETPVPEPASLLLLGSGLALAGSRLRRRFQA